MQKLVLSLSALFMSVVLLVSGNSFLTTLLGVRLSLDQIEPSVIGWVMVFYSIGFVIGSRYMDRVVRRVGHIRAFAVFSAVLAMASLLYPMSNSMVVWGALRLLGGIGAAGLMIVVESWFSGVATNKNRSTLFATYQMCFFLSAAAGQLLLTVAPPESFLPFSLIAILLTASLIPLALTRLQSPSMEAIQHVPIAEIYRIAPLGLVAATANGVLMASFYTMAPVYATMIELPAQQLSLFMATSIVAAMLFAWPIGKLCDRHERARVMLIVCVIAAAASAGIALLGSTGIVPLLFFSSIYLGLSATTYPIAVAIANDRMESNQIVAASGTLLLCFGVGSVIGPVASAQLIKLLGASGLFIGSTLLLLGLAVYTRYFIGRHEQVPVEEQGDFVTTTPEVMPALAELDPRNEDFTESETSILAPDEDAVPPHHEAETPETSGREEDPDSRQG